MYDSAHTEIAEQDREINNLNQEINYLKSEYSQGLEFENITAQKPYGWYVVGIGTCDDKEIIIPPYYKGAPVVAIRFNAFKNNTTIEKVYFPKSIQIIEEEAFSGCGKLKEIFFEEYSELTEIHSAAFFDCSSLSQITNFPAKLNLIQINAFKNCASLQTFTLNSGIGLGEGALIGCEQLKEITCLGFPP